MSNKTNFEVGHIVQLLSGGPSMTVIATEERVATVKWFNSSTYRFVEDKFSFDTLIITGPDHRVH